MKRDSLSTPDLSVNLCGVHLPNPTVLASGVLGLTHEIMTRVARAGAGACAELGAFHAFCEPRFRQRRVIATPDGIGVYVK